MAFSFAQAAAAVRGSAGAPDNDPNLEKKPKMKPEEDPNVVTDQRYLSGLKGLKAIKQRNT